MSDKGVDHDMTGARVRWAPGGRFAPAIAVLLGAAALLAVGGSVWSLHSAFAETPESNWVLMDFRNQIYFPAVAFVAGDNPYDTQVYTSSYPVSRQFAPYLPLHLLVYAPLALLPLQWAEVAYCLLVVALTIALVAFALHIAHVSCSPTLLVGLAAIVMLSKAGRLNVLLGQQGIQMTLFCYAALYLSRRHPLSAGLALAVIMAKPTFGGPVALLMLARGDVVAVVAGGTVAGLASLLAMAGLVEGAGGLVPLVSSMLDNSAQWGRAFLDPMKLPPLLDSVSLVSHAAGRALAPGEQLAVTSVVVGLGVWAVRRLARSKPGYRRDMLSFHIVCLVALTCTYHQVYDFVVLTCMAIGLGAGTFSLVQKSTTANYRTRRLLLALLAIPAFNYLASHSVVDVLALTGVWRRLPSVVNCIATLGILLLCVGSVPKVRVVDAPSRA